MVKIHIKTYGCTHNTADSERMAGLLDVNGFQVVDSKKEADLLILNSCAVKDPAEKKFRHEAKVAREAGLKVVVAGCVPQGNPNDEILNSFSAVGTKNIDEIVDVVKATMKDEVKRSIRKGEEAKNPGLSLPRKQKNSLIHIIPVNSGCLGTCTYCKTVHARGRLESHPVPEIIEAIETVVNNGAKEIWLTSEDVGAYGKDIDTSLSRLLEEIANIRGSFMVRVGMANPEHILKELDLILQLFRKHPQRFYHFLHIPVQASSNAVLKHMERPYTVEEFEEIVTRARAAIPRITIMNDYIVGYPSETEDDFKMTMELTKRTKCRFLNINKFYPRPGTRAAKLQLLPTKIVAKRSKQLVELFESYDPNEGMVGKEVDVLFTEHGKNNSLVGHTQNYTQVVLKAGWEEELLGKRVNVEVLEENKYYLTGTPLKS